MVKNKDTPKPHTNKWVFWGVFEGFEGKGLVGFKGFEGFEGIWGFSESFKSVLRGFKFGCYGNGSHVVLVCPYSSPLPLKQLFFTFYSI